MTLLNQLSKRFASPTPKFWKKVLSLGLVLTAVSSSILVAPEGVEIPDFLKSVAGYLATAGFVLTVVAKATTTDQELSNEG